MPLFQWVAAFLGCPDAPQMRDAGAIVGQLQSWRPELGEITARIRRGAGEHWCEDSVAALEVRVVEVPHGNTACIVTVGDETVLLNVYCHDRDAIECQITDSCQVDGEKARAVEAGMGLMARLALERFQDDQERAGVAFCRDWNEARVQARAQDPAPA